MSRCPTTPALAGWAAVVTLLALSSTALAASPSTPIIVLKSRVGVAGVPELDGLTPELDAQLEAVGFAARPQTISSILGARLPKPGILDARLSVNDIIQPIELGYDMWAHGLFGDAVKKLEPALANIARNPGLLVTDTKNLDSTFKGLVALSLSQSRLGKASESAETMAELIRMFQSRPVSRSEFGRPAEQFWRTISKQVLAGGIGQLSITTGNRQAVVFVDGQIRGIEHAAVADLVPGTHHVFVQVPSTAGRQYEVEVKANENVDLNVSWDVDNSLTVTDPWIGFVFTTEVERNKEALFAGQLARRWGQSMVAVVSTFRLQGAPALIGTLYQTGGKVVRSAVTSLDGDRVAMMRSLARYLADGTVGDGVKIVSSSKEAAVALSDAAPARGGRSQVPAYALGAAGGVAIALGGVFYANAQPTDSIYTDAQARSIYAMIGGSIMVGGGAYLWLRASGLTNERSAALLGGGVAAIASSTVLLLVNQEPSPYLPPSIRDTRVSGIAVGATGLVLTGLGIWLWQKPDGVGHRDSAQVMFSPSTGGGRISYSRTF